ncbi:hypothetical protein BMS3Bbin04_01067 [bacterium BMS3Bbin04]|nr:hypothetical protein BMS3Bbin04_01067 [bacterium BMS3Bbin04]
MKTLESGVWRLEQKTGKEKPVMSFGEVILNEVKALAKE